MDTNINNPKNESDKVLGLNRTLFLVIVALLCVLSICVGIYAQYFYKYSESDPFMMGAVANAKAEEEKERLESNFDNLFTNQLIGNTNVGVTKIDESQALVYTSENVVENSEGLYNINAQIPVINVNNDTAKSMNDDIAKTFSDEIAKIKGSTELYTVYTVDYISYVKEDLLSLAIKATHYKQGDNANQTIILKTYNYNLKNNCSVSLSDVMEVKKLTPKNVQKDINNRLKALNEKEAETGYASVVRDLNSDMYKIENTDTFLVSNENDIYIIYNYDTKKDVLVY